jgi:hypothetical protein
MSRWWLVIALLLSVGLNVGILAAIAARRSGPPPEARDRTPPEIANPGKNPLPLLPRLADRLGLEGDKRQKFIDIQWNLFQETNRLRLQQAEVHREIRREVTRDEPDRQQVDRLLAESSRLYLEMERSLVNNVLATRKLLDAEQQRQYMALLGRLRIAGAPPGEPRLQGPAGEMRQRLLERRLERRGRFLERRRERFQGRFPDEQRPRPSGPPP